MSTLLWHVRRQNIGDDINNVKTTFSSWDNCMSKAYCKWPVIVAIIIAALIVISVITCLARCLCCGAECCCACFSCCNACCPSPRGGRRKNASNYGYQQAPPRPWGGGQYAQPPSGMNYGGNFSQTATFDAPNRSHNATGYNADALPAMPSWDNAREKRVMLSAEEREAEEVEMANLQGTRARAGAKPEAQLPVLLPAEESDEEDENEAHAPVGVAGRTTTDHPYGGASAASPPSALPAVAGAAPYHDYQAHQPFPGSAYGSQHTSAYAPTYHTQDPRASPYAAQHSATSPDAPYGAGFGYEDTNGHHYQQSGNENYSQSIAPSYHTQAPSPTAVLPPAGTWPVDWRGQQPQQSPYASSGPGLHNQEYGSTPAHSAYQAQSPTQQQSSPTSYSAYQSSMPAAAQEPRRQSQTQVPARRPVQGSWRDV